MAIKKTDTAKKPTPAKKAGFTPKKGEEGYVHAKICIPDFKRTSALKMENVNKPFLSKWTPIDFEGLVLNKLGYEIDEVLYYPPGCKTVEQILQAAKEKAEKKRK